ncbi:MAG: hypothetical protein HYR79_11530 [Nitrospirae bacterium]|nr:hypothetical protein [Nitrospirota bacterium]
MSETVIKQADGSYVDDTGKVIYFSTERFINEIALGQNCFICGAHPGSKAFNDEHILSDWILRKYSLVNRKITLPNGTQFKYGSYRIPCCKECNSNMGDIFENKISPASVDLKSFSQLVNSHGSQYIFCWLSLIFIKTHLKDAILPLEQDRRKGTANIGESFYAYETLHHIHCISRSFYTDANWENWVLGSLLIGPAKIMDGVESFDFADDYNAKSVMLRLSDFFIIAVFDDAGAVFTKINETFISKINDGLTALQIRELFARFCYHSIALTEKPKFSSSFEDGKYLITASLPGDKPVFKNLGADFFGKTMYHHCKKVLDFLDGFSDSEKEKILSGNATYLLDENGNFKTDSMIYKPKIS